MIIIRFVIIGNGVTGVTAAQKLAENKAEKVGVHLFSEEGFPYYWKPKLPAFLGYDTISVKDVQSHSLV